MPKYYLTVGQKYSYEEHPGGLHPDYYYSFDAESEEAAHKHIVSLFGEKWAFLYNERNIKPMYFKGERPLEDPNGTKSV